MSSGKLKERALQGLHESLVSALPSLSKDTAVLDVGCGTGAWLERLSQAGFTRLHGLDKDLSAFGCSRATTAQVNLDTEDWRLGDRTFGLITAIEVFEHLENTGLFLANIRKHLAPNGCLLMTTPNIHSVLCRMKFLLTGRLRYFDEGEDATHIHPIYLVSHGRLLARYGLRASKAWTYPRRPGRPGSRWIVGVCARLCGLVLPDPLPGDNLCLLVLRDGS